MRSWGALRDHQGGVHAFVVFCVAAGLRLLTAGRFQTVDEVMWMIRSEHFSDAVAAGRLSDASAYSGEIATMPGVTTMWVGTLGRIVWSAGRELDLWSEAGVAFGQTRASIAISQMCMAVAAAASVTVVAVLVRCWIGLPAGIVCGLVLATEPFFVAHGAVLHTDELSSLFGLASMVAVALLLGLPNRGRHSGRRWVAPTAGLTFGLALLTKLSALMFLPPIGLLFVWSLVSRVRAGDRRALHQHAAWAGWCSLAALAVVVALYPALWLDPGTQLDALWRSAALGGGGHRQFFLGEVTPTPGPLFYLVTVPIRMTPWFLVAGLVALGVAVVQRRLRSLVVVIAVIVAPPFVVLSLASKQFDRYGLVVPAALAVLLGAVAQHLYSPRHVATQWRIAGGLAAVAMVAHSAVVAPWGLAYFNPVLGGSAGAERSVLVGWGEGLELAGEAIRDLQGGECGGVAIRSTYPIPSAFPCGTLVPSGAPANYLVVYVTYRQRASESELRDLIGARPLVATVDVRGMRYADVYGLRAG